jgi:hypothetical protein
VKRIVIGLVLVLAFSLVPLNAIDRSMALAMSVGKRGGDFSLGAQVMAPSFLDGLLTIFGDVDLLYKEGKIPGAVLKWYPYLLASIGLQVTAAQTDWMRLYASSALTVFLPCTEVRSLWHVGGYGGFGVELFFASGGGSSYYIEIGGAGTTARADILMDEPYLGNGLTIKAGCRFLLGKSGRLEES